MAKGKNHGSKRRTLHDKYKIQKKVHHPGWFHTVRALPAHGVPKGVAPLGRAGRARALSPSYVQLH
jgi:hypothetical protein